MKAILCGNAQITKAVNATLISLDQASDGYKQFDGEASRKLVIDPHRMDWP